MGWSCSSLAGRTMDKWEDFCYKQTGVTNKFKDGNKEFMFEPSRVEHNDGSITGSIYRYTYSNQVVKAGSFKINGMGTVERAPSILKKI